MDEQVKITKKKAISPLSGAELPTPGPGRPKGSQNKFTNLKDAFMEVFKRLDGVDGLETWVNDSKRNKELFYQWITKMLPSNIAEDVSGEITINYISRIPHPDKKPDEKDGNN